MSSSQHLTASSRWNALYAQWRETSGGLPQSYRTSPSADGALAVLPIGAPPALVAAALVAMTATRTLTNENLRLDVISKAALESLTALCETAVGGGIDLVRLAPGPTPRAGALVLSQLPDTVEGWLAIIARAHTRQFAAADSQEAPADAPVPSAPATQWTPAPNAPASISTLTRPQLINLVWTFSVRHASASLGISAKTLLARCKALRVPTPPRGYWQRVGAGRLSHTDGVPHAYAGALSEASAAELHQLAWQHPQSEVAARFNVARSTLRRKLSKLGIQAPPPGYWANRAPGA